jgi:uncharacterized protein YjbI with pentapeptide repeats
MAITPDPQSPSALQAAVNDSAGRAAALWTTFVTLGAYLLVATGSVKHRDLFLDASIKLPILGVELPVTGYFVVAPLVLLIFHCYLLLQLERLSIKTREYNFLVREEVPVSSDRRLVGYRLIDFPFLQYLAGAGERRLDHARVFPISISLLTIILFPLVLLLQFQLMFLPYQAEWITWIHRLCLALDVAVVWYFWLRVAHDPDAGKKSAWVQAMPIGGAAILLCFSWLIATFPGEMVYRNCVARGLDRLSSFILRDQTRTVSRFLFEGEIDSAKGQPQSLFANRIILPGERFFDIQKHEKSEISVSLRGRILRGAALQYADLRKVHFTGAILQDASFVGASLQGARFGCPPTVDADAEARLRFRARAATCDEERKTDLRHADFTEAAMQGATLEYAQLQGARLTGAKAQGASFDRADLTAALMGDMHLEGASLVGAKLFGAYLIRANLLGADLGDASFEAAQLSYAQLQGANIAGTNFAWAMMINSNLFRAHGVNRAGLEELCKSASCTRVTASPNVRKAFRIGRSPPEGYAASQDIKTLDVAGYRTLLGRATEGVETDRLKKLIEGRLASLDPAKATIDSEQITAGAAVSTERASVGKLSAERTEAACEAMCDPTNGPTTVRAMIYNGRILNLSNAGPELIAFLRSAQCAGARGLGAEYLRRLGVEETRVKSLARTLAKAAERRKAAGQEKEAEARKPEERKPLQCKRVEAQKPSDDEEDDETE